MQIDRIDHVVLTAANIEATCAFYERVLGMKVVTFGPNRNALAFGNSKINLHEQGKEFEPKAHWPTPGSADLCLIVREPMEEVVGHLRACGVPILEGENGGHWDQSSRCTSATRT